MLSPQDEEFLNAIKSDPLISHRSENLLRIVGELKKRVSELEKAITLFPYLTALLKERDGLREELKKQAEWYERKSTPNF